MYLRQTLVAALLALTLIGCSTTPHPLPQPCPVPPIEVTLERDKPILAMEQVRVPLLESPVSEKQPDEQPRAIAWLIGRLYAALAQANTQINSLSDWINEE